MIGGNDFFNRSVNLLDTAFEVSSQRCTALLHAIAQRVRTIAQRDIRLCQHAMPFK